jgi:hypothetical protein
MCENGLDPRFVCCFPYIDPLDWPCCTMDYCFINEEKPDEDSDIIDWTHCKSAFAHTVVYECCFACPSDNPKYVRMLRVAQSWHSPAVCRVVNRGDWGHDPIEANKIERTLEEGASEEGATKPTPRRNQKDAWKTIPEKGDTVVVHHGPCCHWVCNRMICPCWNSGSPKLISGNAIRVHRIMASSGL